ncbi:MULTISPECIES: hypothetical protein [Nocardia]|uniref:hypothetical protein n=1 Tax=Nocardia TaxID=1817 RepID=UPI00135A9B03|nr:MULTISPECIES: hypothetical protein [Nocardia]
MENDEQMTMDLGVEIHVDEKLVQQRQAWTAWIAPERMKSQIRKFLTETLPDVHPERSPCPWWERPLLSRIEEAADTVFLDKLAILSPENFDTVDQYARFLGDYFVRQAGAQWFDAPASSAPIYEAIGPSLRFDYTDDVFSVLYLVQWAIEEGCSDVTMEAHSMGLDWTDWKTHSRP